MQYLCERASEHGHLRVKAHGGSNPFRTGPLIAQFYLWQPVEVEESDFESNDEEGEYDMIVLQRKDSAERKRLMSEGYREVHRSMPQWQDVLNRFYKTYNPDRVLIAYEK